MLINTSIVRRLLFMVVGCVCLGFLLNNTSCVERSDVNATAPVANDQIGALKNLNLRSKDAVKFIANLEASQPEDELKSVFFSEASLRAILDKKGSEGIRFHLGKGPDGKTRIFAEPTNKVGYSLPTTLDNEGEGQFFSADGECPKECPPDN